MYVIIPALIVAIIIFSLVWRFSSRRQSLPCPSWLRWMVELDNPFTKTNRAEEIISHLDIKPGMTIADIGCGPGRLAIPLARKAGAGGEVIALDIQEGMLARVKAKAQAEELKNITFLQGGVGEGKLEAESLDCALLVTVLGEIPEREKALQEIHASLKKDGLLSITEVIFDPHFQRRSTVRNLAAKTGFMETAFFGNAIAYTMHLRK